MKKTIRNIVLILALLLLPTSMVLAAETKSGGSIYIAKDEIAGSNLYAAGQTIVIDGAVSGDLIAAAQNIKINGRIEGDLIAAAQEITINGEVGGNVRVVGNSITINGAVARNVNAFGSSISIGSGAQIGWDLLSAAANTEIRGTIEGGATSYAKEILIGGKIGRNVYLNLTAPDKGQEIIIAPEAIINGNLTYSTNSTAKISEKANLAGQVQQVSPTAGNKDWAWLWQRTFAIVSALVVGFALIFIAKNITGRITASLEERPLKAILPGLILTFVLPPIALVLAMTVIGLPLALIISTMWLIAVYVAKIITALVLGRLLVKKLIKKDATLFVSLVIGIFISWLLFSIPYVGWIISLFATCFGMGGIWFYVSHQLKHI